LSSTALFKLIAAASLVGAVLICLPAAVPRRQPGAPPRLELTPPRIWADGYDSATLTIEMPDDVAPLVKLTGTPQTATASEPEYRDRKWQVQIRAGVMPGQVAIRVELPNTQPGTASLAVALSESDKHEDGTPDFLRLDEPGDQQAFRHWFTYLAEAQYFQDPAARPSEIDDCAALIRYAYREALHAHNNAWTAQAHLPLIPALVSVAKYDYPHTALGATLFRNRSGPFREADLNSGAFTQFADVKSLWRFNTYLISRSLNRAQPGDLIFYRQTHDTRPDTFHSMIYLGSSQLRPDGERYVVYHTGPQGSRAGEIRRLTLQELQHFPEGEWRPDSGNPAFLGVFRWNILKPGEAQP
jgi:uncharacterized protein YfaT (DUF1175 family)